MSEPDKRRCVIFCRSVVSPLDNRDAYLLRALAQTLTRQGHDVLIYEERGNPAFRALLRQGGSQALTRFAAEHPEIHYHTYEPRVGAELVKFLTQVLATADIGVAFAGVPTPVAHWIGRLTRPHLATAFVESGLCEPLPDEVLRDIDLAEYGVVLLGNPARAKHYAQLAPTTHVSNFGPVPPFDEHSDPATLRPVAEALAAQILRAPARITG